MLKKKIKKTKKTTRNPLCHNRLTASYTIIIQRARSSVLTNEMIFYCFSFNIRILTVSERL